MIESQAPPVSTATDYMPFRPALEERLMERFARSARDLCAYPLDDRGDLIRREIAWAATQAPHRRQAAVYKAVWHLIGDLMRAGWSYRWDRSTFQVAPPPAQARFHDDASIQAFKARCRDLYAEARVTGLAEARDFILSMERRRPATGAIQDLFADGAALAADLRRVAAGADGDAQVRELVGIVQPYLQLVEANARCQFTGLRLSDIWRYCRLTWAIPRYNTPGRSLFYLVRDRARPNHPIMGILSLENAPIFIAARDDYVGWSVDSFVQSLIQMEREGDGVAAVRDRFAFLVQSVIDAARLIAADDLCTSAEREDPTEYVVQRLGAIAAQAANERVDALRRWRERDPDDGIVEGEDPRDGLPSAYGSVSQRAQEELFRKKRARELARLLSARMTLQESLLAPAWADEWHFSPRASVGAPRFVRRCTPSRAST